MGVAPFPSSVPDDRMDQVRTRYVQPDPNIEGFEEFYYADTGEVIPPDDPEEVPAACLDVGPEEFEKLTSAIGARLAAMAGISLEVAELAAVSVVCAIPVDENGMLHFTDPEGRAVASLPYDDFSDLLEGDEEEDE